MSSQNSPYNYRLFHFISYTYSEGGHYYTDERRVESRNIENFVFPRTCISFELFDRVSRQSDLDETVFIGEVVNRSQYYIGKSYDLATVAKELGVNSPIYRELLADGATKIVKIYDNEYLNICPSDTILSPQQVKRADDFKEISPTPPAMSR